MLCVRLDAGGDLLTSRRIAKKACETRKVGADIAQRRRPGQPCWDEMAARKRNGACSSAGEHYVDIVGVTGSIPVTPTISSLISPLEVLPFLRLLPCVLVFDWFVYRLRCYFLGLSFCVYLTEATPVSWITFINVGSWCMLT